MSAHSYHAADIGCPYYKDDDGRSFMKCEAVLPLGINQKTSFDSKLAFDKQMRECTANFGECPIYLLLNLMYEKGFKK